jgi:FkbM family methyltransferase
MAALNQDILNFYLSYLHYGGVNLEAHNFTPLVECLLQDCDLDEPQSARELNNFAVLTLIEAQQSNELALRSMGLNLAQEALEKGQELEDHPLCQAHLALLYLLLGERQVAINLAFSGVLKTLEKTPQENPGLLFFPPQVGNLHRAWREYLEQFLSAATVEQQALGLCSMVLSQASIAFYSPQGLRFLHLAHNYLPQSAAICLQLGIAQLVNQQLEGLCYLHQAQALAPDNAQIEQALSIAYQDLQPPQTATITYVPFEGEISLAVESSLRSYVTSVLIAQGDWFEAEMAWWRSQIQAGMTVIDVGANVGVYTFSAARRVGNRGRVFAVEPFAGCAQCLRATVKRNHFECVTVVEAAASDYNGKAYLALKSASELNEVLPQQPAPSTSGVAQIDCLTLDTLAQQQQIQRLDWLKIDAEGHEIKVLEGSTGLIARFAPKILYENIASEQGNNLPVVQFLTDKGYNLFRYRPYLEELIPLDSRDDLQGNLNIIALPPNTP